MCVIVFFYVLFEFKIDFNDRFSKHRLTLKIILSDILLLCCETYYVLYVHPD